MFKRLAALVSALTLVVLTFNACTTAQPPQPLRVLLITGGCCHDYAKQKDILKAGLESRANVVVTQVHTDDKSTKPPLAIYGNADYAKGFDLVLHDECAAAVSDPATIKAVLAPHRAGIPGVNLHCAMHCYRIGNPNDKATAGEERSAWFDYLGLQSSGHGPQEPIAISFTEKNHAIARGLADWTTIKEEHYNNIQIFPTATPIAHGKQTVTDRKDGSKKENDYVVAWANDYHGTRVFSTTIGHNNETVSDARYLDLVTHGVLWACGKINPDGMPKPGYGPKK
ncbi:MAG: ThuA domain-containing protein [Verrucomicrobia bacterium]|nr:ThuA domain-containing protein [Verrucomicrobiota bacterium]